jgi:uncharacterized protein YjcR
MIDERRMKGTNRTNVAAYVAAQRHLRGNLRGPKTLTQMAAELGTTKSTVRRWPRRDHWDLWMEHWASVEEIWEAAIHDRARLLEEKRSSDEGYPMVLVAELDRCLAELTNEVCIIQ